MSDRVVYTVSLHAWDPEKSDLIEQVVSTVLGEPDEMSDTMLWYFERRAGEGNAIAVLIRSLDPTCAFRVWEDPSAEYLGDVTIGVPGHDLFQAQCDSGGRVVHTFESLSKALAEGRTIEQAFGQDLVALLPVREGV